MSSYRLRRFYILSLLLITIPLSLAFSQKFKVNAYVDSSRILIGDQLKFTFEVEQPRNAKVAFPILKDSIASKIEIVESEPADTIKLGDNIRIKKNYLVTSFDSGYHKIPAFKFPFKADKFTDTLTTQEFYLTVNTLPVDSAKSILDIKPVMNTPFSLSEIKKELLVGFLILIIVGLGIWIYLRYRKNKPIFAAKKPDEPPHIIAIRELDKLREEKLWQNNQVKLYYTKLTDILRNYIWGRYDVNAMEMTSEEILKTLEMELNQDMELKSSFSRLLMQADLVKFAKAEPFPQDNETAILSAYLFVNRTKIEVLKPVSEMSAQEQNEQETNDKI